MTDTCQGLMSLSVPCQDPAGISKINKNRFYYYYCYYFTLCFLFFIFCFLFFIIYFILFYILYIFGFFNFLNFFFVFLLLILFYNFFFLDLAQIRTRVLYYFDRMFVTGHMAKKKTSSKNRIIQKKNFRPSR